jgi:hypothetical protein
MLDLTKFGLKANHIVNLAMIVIGAAWIFYNHVAREGWTPIDPGEFAGLVPMAVQYLNAIKAHKAESPRLITANQVLCILEMAEERGIDARARAREKYGVSLGALGRKQATAMIVQMKKEPKLDELIDKARGKGDEGGTGGRQ